MIKNIFTWNQIYNSDIKIQKFGGKGYNLSKLNYFGFNVPNGGVLNSDIYKQIVNREDILILIKKVQKNLNDLLLKEIRGKFFEIKLNKNILEELKIFLKENKLSNIPLAIRSSATLEDSKNSSFAGIHESYLNINSLEEIEYSILNCFASLWTMRAVSYRRKLNIDDLELNCAVVIMQMINAKSSGIAFSCEPISARQDLTIINTNFGLGESVVNGVIEPDEYKVNSHNLKLENIKIGSKLKYSDINKDNGTYLKDSSNNKNRQVLNEKQIKILTMQVQIVFWVLGDGKVHQDIEWVFDGEEFFLLQARPVTVLKPPVLNIFKNQQEVWSNGNFRDAAPMVQHTLGTSIFSYHINAILKAPFKSFGYKLSNGLNFVKLYKGRAYLNISLLQWIYFDATGFLPSATNKTIGGHQSEITIDKIFLGGINKKLKRVWRLIKMMRIIKKYKKLALNRELKEIKFAKEILNIKLDTLSNKELSEKIKLCDSEITNYALTFAVQSSMSGTITALSDLLEKYLPNEGDSIANSLLSGAGNITSANHGYELQKIINIAKSDIDAESFFNNTTSSTKYLQNLPNSSSFKKAFNYFIDKYGHRGIYEGDLSYPRWREDSSFLLNIIKENIANINPLKKDKQQQKKTEKLWIKIKKAVPFYLQPMVKSLLKQSIEGAELREMAKSTFIRLLEPSRYLLLEAGERFQSLELLENRNDIFHCAYVEIISILSGNWSAKGLKELVNSRKKQKEELEKLSAVDLIIDDKPLYSSPIISNKNSKIKGLGVSSGSAKGVAKIVHNPQDGISLKQGDILVAPSTDPAWTPLFLNVSAIVMETGGQLSHGAIVAREYGIPAVVNVKGLFNIIKDGESIIVNGDNGDIEKIGD